MGSTRRSVLSKTCEVKPNEVPIYYFRPKRTKINREELKSYWGKYIERIENYVMKASRSKECKKIRDLSTSLPIPLYKRVAKIIDLPPIHKCIFEDLVETPQTFQEPDEKSPDEGDSDQVRELGLEKQKKSKREGSYRESQIDEILDMEREYKALVPKIDLQSPRRKKNLKNVNWFSNYICKKRRERVKWQTRIYDLEKCIMENPLAEQAEHLNDAAAGRFCDFVNSLSENKDTNIDKETVLKLFSVDMDSTPLKNIHIEPKPIRAVPNAVAVSWKLPELSIELKLEKYHKELKERKVQEAKSHAFGRMLPPELRQYHSVEYVAAVEPQFPKDVLTREVIFKGISHLRSTRALVDYYRRSPHLERPKYLVDQEMFEPKVVKSHMDYVPFYRIIESSQ